MRKIIALIMILCFIFPFSAHADTTHPIFVNKVPLKGDYGAIVENDEIYVPMWALLGQLNMSAEVAIKEDGMIRINHPHRVLLVVPDSNLIAYFGTSMDKHSARLDYPIITKDYVEYVPLKFLSDYLDMQIAWGDNGRIDITAGDFSKNVSWVDEYTVTRAAKRLEADTTSEKFWGEHPTIWYDKKQYSVVSYSGTDAVIVNDKESRTVSYMYPLTYEFLFNLDISSSDPLADYDWSAKIKEQIRLDVVSIGMSKKMAELSWGEPKKINKDVNTYGTSEQWVYDGGYLYFDNGILTAIQN